MSAFKEGSCQIAGPSNSVISPPALKHSAGTLDDNRGNRRVTQGRAQIILQPASERDREHIDGGIVERDHRDSVFQKKPGHWCSLWS